MDSQLAVQRRAAAYKQVYRARRARRLARWLRRLPSVRAWAYRRMLGGEDLSTQIVLADQAHFCYAARTTHDSDSCCGRAEREGRRQVWLRINYNLHLGPADIDAMYRRVASMGE